MTDREPTFSPADDRPGREAAVPSRADRVRIRLPTGEYEWVTPEAFNLISEREFQDSEQLRRLRRQRNAALAVAAVAALALLAASLYSMARPGRVASGEPAPAALVDPTPGASMFPEPRSEPAAAEAPAAPDPAAAIERTVRDWAAAWTAQDADHYLSFYSARFRVPGGMDRSRWEGVRRDRFERRRLLAVTVSEIETTAPGDGTAVARFVQVYRTPGYRNRVLKTLELATESGRWRIVAESSSFLEAEATGAGSP